MKEPIIHDGKPFDWKAGSEAAAKIVGLDGEIHWGAAFMADPGVMKCPGCGVYLWQEGRIVECPDCGFAWNQELAIRERYKRAEGSPRGQDQVGERRCIILAKFDDRRQFNTGRSSRRLGSAGDNERSHKERRRRTTPPPAPEPEGAPRTVGPCPFLLPVSARYDKDHEEWDLVDADNDRLFSIKSWDGGEAIVQYIAAALNSYGRTVEDE